MSQSNEYWNSFVCICVFATELVGSAIVFFSLTLLILITVTKFTK